MSAEARVRGLPFWKGAIDLVPLKGGVSNASFTVQDSAGKYVARVGADYPFHHVFREAEVICQPGGLRGGAFAGGCLYGTGNHGGALCGGANLH